MNQPLTLFSNLSESDSSVASPTNIGRELIYCLEHAIHHMAIIRVGIEQTWPEVLLETEFGVAPSTIKHQRLCAP